MPKRIFDQLAPGYYEVVIRTEEAPGALKDSRIQTPGLARLHHRPRWQPGSCGCGQRRIGGLRGGPGGSAPPARPKDQIHVSLVLSPGIIGSELYLAGLNQSERSRILEGIFLEMLGSATPLAVQESRRCLVSALHALRPASTSLASLTDRPVESIIVNDEYVWENYGIPMLSFSRFPYPEYHSSRDSMEIIEETSLNEAVDALIGAVDWLEASPLVIKKFEGNVCLSNPQYDLYVDYGQIALGDTLSAQGRQMRCLMDFVPALDRPVSVKAVADPLGCPKRDS